MHWQMQTCWCGVFDIRRRRMNMAETNKTLSSTVEIYRDIKICVSWHWNVIGTSKIFKFRVSSHGISLVANNANTPRKHKIQHNLPQPLAGITSKMPTVFFPPCESGVFRNRPWAGVQALKFVSAKKGGSINNVIKPFMQHELVLSTQLETILVKIGNFPQFSGWKLEKISNNI